MKLEERKRKCFVIMPFGEKTDLDGNDIDFDDIYRFFFKKAIEDLGIDCVRCDEIEEAGSIHEKMFEQIYQADVVVVDITTSNANVYYELGIRHALAKGLTILIRRKGTVIPFNIQGLQVVEYDQSRFASIEQAKLRIHQIIHNGLVQRRNDSPVHAVLDLNIEPEGKPIDSTEFFEWRLADSDDLVVGLVTGDIQNVIGIDVWVNPENTSMQMARPFENSISGIVRYLGAEKDPENGQIRSDTIAKALEERMGGRTTVDPATVLVTTAGAMEGTHKVRRIFHAAANYGQVGQGYIPIDYVARCVTNALKTPVDDAALGERPSILFPLMATRSRKGAVLDERVRPLLGAAIESLARNPQGSFRRVYFLAYTDKELEVCHQLLREDARLRPLAGARGPVADLAAESPVSRKPAAAKPAGPAAIKAVEMPRSGTS
ncbi:MAG: hypothetical protein JNL87_03970 [Burkholderiaceae bacterium]|nr:hypothetical protein [Burkholderiaceae bacterium]